jgi:hypothetical protein
MRGISCAAAHDDDDNGLFAILAFAARAHKPA